MTVATFEKLDTYECLQCGFWFEYLRGIGRPKSVCDECRPIRDKRLMQQRQREWVERRRRALEEYRSPKRSLGGYDMAHELTKLRLIVEIIGPLMRTGQWDKALAFLYWGEAPARFAG